MAGNQGQERQGAGNKVRITQPQQCGTTTIQDTPSEPVAIEPNSMPPITQNDAVPPITPTTGATREPSQHTSVASTPNDVDNVPSPSSVPTNSVNASTIPGNRIKRRITLTNKEYV